MGSSNSPNLKQAKKLNMKYGKRILIKTLFLILILSMKKGGGSVKAACFCMNKQRIFFDLDGVLAVWQDVPQEHLTQKGYFSSIPIQENVVAAFRLLEQLPDIELYILSCVFQDSHSESDKKAWVKEHLHLPEERQIYCPCGGRKEHALEKIGGIRPSDVLIDDYTENLRYWAGIPIKFYNGINGTKGTWQGNGVYFVMQPETIAKQIYELAVIQPYSILQRIACWNAVFPAY